MEHFHFENHAHVSEVFRALCKVQIRKLKFEPNLKPQKSAVNSAIAIRQKVEKLGIVNLV